MKREYSEPVYLHIPLSRSAELQEYGISATSVRLYLPGDSGEVELGFSPASNYTELLAYDEDGRPMPQLVVCSEENLTDAIEAVSEAILNRRLQEAGSEGIPLDYDGETVDIGLMDIDLTGNVGFCAPSQALLDSLSDFCSGQAVIIRGFSGTEEHKLAFRLLEILYEAPCFVIISTDTFNTSWVRKLVIRYDYEVSILPPLTEKDYSESIGKHLASFGMKLAPEVTPGILYKLLTHAFDCGMDSELMAETVKRIRKCAGDRLGSEGAETAFEITLNDINRALLLEVKTTEKPGPARSLSEYRGLDEVKKLTERIIAIEREKRRNPMLGDIRNHVVLLGNPGTGKTTSAKLIYEALRAEKIISGPWVSASRSDLIGKFVGETAHKVTGIFKQAEGGVLFIDEAGFLLGAGDSGNGGAFLREAVKEFVRFMENGTNVICIFGMYASEKDAFLELDEGLSSRVHHFVELKCSGEQLIAIFRDMVDSKGYEIDEEAVREAGDFFAEQKRRTGESFGNAREARRLLEAAIVELCLRRNACEGEDGPGTGAERITSDDIKKAASRLLTKEKPVKSAIGF